MPTSWVDKYAECPFYKYDDGKKSVTCEGYKKTCVVRTIFVTNGSMEVHLKAFCCKDYQKCPLYPLLVKKYER